MVDYRDSPILVVDDDHSVTDVIKEMLEAHGCSVLTAYSGEQALELYARNPIGLVITDIQMGGISGFELITRLRLVDTTVKVIVITGNDTYESVLKSLQHGAYDYLKKPLQDSRTVIAAVERAKESTILQRENTALMMELRKSHRSLEEANKNLRSVNQKLKKLAATDSLTLLYNRRFFDQVAKREIDRRNRYQSELSIILIDVDHFKAFNDTYGHAGGDQALKHISKLLVDCARATDFVARYGGEEFIILLPQTSPANAVVFAERVRRVMAKTPLVLGTTTTPITISMGICGTGNTSTFISLKAMFASADKALYQAKREGRDRHVVADGNINDEAA